MMTGVSQAFSVVNVATGQTLANVSTGSTTSYVTCSGVREGWLETAGGGCPANISGWTWLSSDPTGSVLVDILNADNGSVLATTTANVYRPDVGNYTGQSYHGYSIATPPGAETGGIVHVSVRVTGTSTILPSVYGGNSIAVNCPVPPAQPPPCMTFPSAWNGIEYFPAAFPRWQMFHNWNSISSTVDSDLAQLASRGFNVIHVYAWDNDTIANASSQLTPDPSGFSFNRYSSTTLPTDAPNAFDYTGLDRLLSLAQNHNLFVAITFVDVFVLTQLGNSNYTASQFNNWTAAFVQGLMSKHYNIASWGTLWQHSVIPDATNVLQDHGSMLWGQYYYNLDSTVRQAATNQGCPGSVPLISVELDLGQSTLNGGLVARGAGYDWGRLQAQQKAAAMATVLQYYYGYAKAPDLYRVQLYNANSFDLYWALLWLPMPPIGGTTPPATGIPAGKLFVSEFATSSSINSDSQSPNLLTSGDKQVPTGDAALQAQWLQNTLCTLQQAGVTKFSYWSSVDEAPMWSSPSWSLSGQDLAWSGYWGLKDRFGNDKAAAPILQAYNRGTLSCSLQDRQPASYLLPEASYFTAHQPISVVWTAADFTNNGITFVPAPISDTLDCRHYNIPGSSRVNFGADRNVSCGETTLAPFGYTGAANVTMTVRSQGLVGPGSLSSINNPSVTLLAAPRLDGVQAMPGGFFTPITSAGSIQIIGQGFSKTGGNILTFTRSGYATVTMSAGNNASMVESVLTLITVNLQGLLAPGGTWSLTVTSPYEPNSASGPISFYVNQ